VLAATALFVYKLVKVRRILADGGVELGGRRPFAGARTAVTARRVTRTAVWSRR
jgi:hypothetical protein